MCTLLWCIYYDLARKNISLEGRHLVLTLLASTLSYITNQLTISTTDMQLLMRSITVLMNVFRAILNR